MTIFSNPRVVSKNGDPESSASHSSGIVHFDATMVRKDKMRDRAVLQGGTALQPQMTTVAAASSPLSDTTSTEVATDSEAPSPSVSIAAADSQAAHSNNGASRAKKVAPPPEQLETFLINFVVEQTGYPAEIVDLDADLEADLGIDSIKKAQLFGELREYFDFEMTATEDMTLDDFSTLQHVVDYLRKTSDSSEAGTPASMPASNTPVSNDQPASTVATLSSSSPVSLVGSNFAPEDTAPVKTDTEEPTSDQLEPFLINFVVEQTGYPAEIVELDADLEADLGIDSIKKAQLFGELREYFDITPSEDLSLDDFLTLRHVMEFLQGTQQKQQTSGLTPSSPPALDQRETGHGPDTMDFPAEVHDTSNSSPSASTAGFADSAVTDKAPSPEQLEPFLVNFVVEQTGYPSEIVELDADLEADLGIDSIKKAQLFGELREYFDITPSEELTLDDFVTLRDVLNFLQGIHPHGSQEELPSTQFTDQDPQETTTAQPMHPSNSESATTNSAGTEKTPPSEQLDKFLINFVVEQTGYPPEIVELDADLEADLGIDSIKKAQLFGELREYFEFDITPTEDLTLDDFSTLRDVMIFLQGAHPQPKSATDASVRPAPTSSSINSTTHRNGKPVSTDERSILETLSRIILEKSMANDVKASLTSTTRLIDDVGLDSVGMLDLITAVEQHYAISISLEDLEIESLNNSGAFASLIGRKLAEKN
jgi:acyl carrier protein